MLHAPHRARIGGYVLRLGDIGRSFAPTARTGRIIRQDCIPAILQCQAFVLQPIGAHLWSASAKTGMKNRLQCGPGRTAHRDHRPPAEEVAPEPGGARQPFILLQTLQQRLDRWVPFHDQRLDDRVLRRVHPAGLAPLPGLDQLQVADQRGDALSLRRQISQAAHDHAHARPFPGAVFQVREDFGQLLQEVEIRPLLPASGGFVVFLSAKAAPFRLRFNLRLNLGQLACRGQRQRLIATHVRANCPVKQRPRPVRRYLQIRIVVLGPDTRLRMRPIGRLHA